MKTVNTLVWEDFKALWNEGINPLTGEEDEDLQKVFVDVMKNCWREEETDIGTFSEADSWNLGDGHEQARVIKHHETDTYLCLSGWYSSWDSSMWNNFSEVQPYQKTVTRYRTVDGHSQDIPEQY